MGRLGQDLKYGFRMLLKNAGFTAVAIIVLAIGIGANTAIFSVVDAVLLRSLPYNEPDRILQVWDNNLQRGADEVPISFPKFTEMNQQNEVFEGISAYVVRSFTQTGSDEPEQIQGARVSADFFKVLDKQPAIGRAFTPEEDAVGGNPVVILSHEFWLRRFNGSQTLLGNTLMLDDKATTVIGVMPPGFRFPDESVSVWVPRVFEISVPNAERVKLGAGYLGVVARLKPGIDMKRAKAELDTISDRYRQHYPNNMDVDNGTKLVLLQEQLVRDVKPRLFVLLGAVTLVLLVACANVTNLLLVRTAARQKEIAIRAALGATRSQLIRQLLAENILLSLIGGCLGLLLAYWGVKLLVGMAPGDIPRMKEVSINTGVLFFTLATSVLAGIVTVLFPALQLSRTDLNESLKEGGRSGTTSPRRNRVRNIIVVAEVALALILLIAASLLIKSFMRLQGVNPGFDPSNVLTMQVSLPRSRYSEGFRQAAFYQQVLERVEQLPGVQSAGVASFLPLTGGGIRFFFNIEGQPRLGPGKDPLVAVRVISPDYFKTMGIPLISGRYFTNQDVNGSLKTVIINETMAQRFFSGEDPVGRRLAISANYGPDGWLTIVGVVGNVHSSSLDAESGEELYLPYTQSPWISMYVLARTTSDPLDLSRAVRAQVLDVDKDQPVSNIQSLEQVISASIAQPRLTVFLLSAFAGAAVLLAALGIYGVMSYSVTQRMHEIGIRLALGARQSDILRVVIVQGMAVALAGVGIGLVVAFYVTRGLKSLLYGISSTDPITFFSVPLALITVALLACYLPARRATRVDPMIVLRSE